MALNYILLEDGSGHILLEDSSGSILLENQPGSTSLVFSTSGTILGTGQLSGTSSLSFVPSSTAFGSGVLSGPTSLLFSPVATLSASGTLSGGTSLTFTSTGTGSDDIFVSGSTGINFISSGNPIAYAFGSGIVNLKFNSYATETLIQSPYSLNTNSSTSLYKINDRVNMLTPIIIARKTDAGSFNPVNTPFVTIPTGNVTYAFISTIDTSNVVPLTPTISDTAGHTWTQVSNHVSPAFGMNRVRTTVYQTVGNGIPTVISVSNASFDDLFYEIIQFPGADTNVNILYSYVDAGIGQSTTNTTNLSGTPNAVFTWGNFTQSSSYTSPTGYTLLANTTYTGNILQRVASAYCLSTSPTTITWASTGFQSATVTFEILPQPTSIKESQIVADSVFKENVTTPTVVQTLITAVGPGTWTVPSDWSGANSIEVIGGGSSGLGGLGITLPGAGGAYSKVSNISLIPGAVIPYFVGNGGIVFDTGVGYDGQDTWIGDVVYANSFCAAKGGSKPITTPGIGGQASLGIGSVCYSGGNGGTNTVLAGGGAGGAGGPNGNGANGGNNTVNSGVGGGASGGGTTGTIGGANFPGGSGGNNYLGTGSGAGGSSLATPGSPGTNGGGGGGGGRTANGGAGGNGSEWDATHGSGGGAGSAGSTTAYTIHGADGGLYGGGGGAPGFNTTNGTFGGNGGQGIIVITYTPDVIPFAANEDPDKMILLNPN